MSKLLFIKDGQEIRTWDIVELTNGMKVMMLGSEFKYPNIDENTRIFLCTSPISSQTSYCYPEHVQTVIHHSGCFENAVDYMFKNKLSNPLFIKLERNGL